jgi:hypothetical protein
VSLGISGVLVGAAREGKRCGDDGKFLHAGSCGGVGAGGKF